MQEYDIDEQEFIKMIDMYKSRADEIYNLCSIYVIEEKEDLNNISDLRKDIKSLEIEVNNFERELRRPIQEIMDRIISAVYPIKQILKNSDILLNIKVDHYVRKGGSNEN